MDLLGLRGGNPAGVDGLSGGFKILNFNDAGQVLVSDIDGERAFRYTPAAGWQEILSPIEGGVLEPHAMNSSGAVSGAIVHGEGDSETPFIYRDASGVAEILPDFGDGRVLNDHFVVAGRGGYTWFPDTMRLVDIRGGQAVGTVYPQDINEHASIIGFALSSGFFGNAFYWDEVEGYQNLSDLVTDPMWQVSYAQSINNDGWILANGYYGTGQPQPDSEFSWLLLRPIPEPGSLALLAGAATFLLRRRR